MFLNLKDNPDKQNYESNNLKFNPLLGDTILFLIPIATQTKDGLLQTLPHHLWSQFSMDIGKIHLPTPIKIEIDSFKPLQNIKQ